MIDRQTIGNRIKIIRKQLKLNQSEFSNEIDVTQQTISQIEHGTIAPSLEIIIKITSKYSISYNWLFDNEGSMLKATVPEYPVDVGECKTCSKLKEELQTCKEELYKAKDELLEAKDSLIQAQTALIETYKQTRPAIERTVHDEEHRMAS